MIVSVLVWMVLAADALPWAIVNYNDCNCLGSMDTLVEYFLDELVTSHQILGYSIYTSPHRCSDEPEVVAMSVNMKHPFSFLTKEYPELDSDPPRLDVNTNAKAFVQGVTEYYLQFGRNSTELSGFLLMNDDSFFRSCTMDWTRSWMTAERDVIPTDISSGRTPRHASTWPSEAKFRHWRPDVFAKMEKGLLELKLDKLISNVHYENLRLNANGQEDMVSFHQVDLFFIRKESTETFIQMMAPFMRLGMNPEIYVPYIYRMMFPPCPLNFFIMPHRERFGEPLLRKADRHNGFFAVHGVKLLKTCNPPIVSQQVVRLIQQFTTKCKP